MTINPANWYWYVGSDRTQVYSSAVGDLVPVSTPAFVEWQAADPANIPPVMGSLAEVGTELARHVMRPTNAAALDGYQDEQTKNIVAQAIFKILFNHENRLRAIERNLGLNGSPPNLTPAQAKNAVKALM